MGELVEELDYLDLEKDHNDTLMKIRRDTLGRFIGETKEQVANQIYAFSRKMKKGWYQDSKGSLFCYDGIVWDAVPEAPLSTLEYLG